MQPTKTIKLYTSTTCASCEMVKKWLKMKSFGYQEINVEESIEAMQDAINLSQQNAVPVVLIEDGTRQEVIIGFKPSQLSAALL